MKHVPRLLLAFGLVALVAAPAATADPPKKGKTIDVKSEKPPAPAAGVNFNQALGLSLDNLKTIGERIDAARTACDPVALAGLAKELGAAEEVSGKKAEVTSKELTDQTIQMAKLRARPDELRTVAKILGGDAADQLKTEADKIGKADEQRQKTQDSGHEKGITGDLYVKNRTGYYVDVYVNFSFRGTVAPFDTGVTYVGDFPLDTTDVYCESTGGTKYWHTSVSEPVDDYTFTLLP